MHTIERRSIGRKNAHYRETSIGRKNAHYRETFPLLRVFANALDLA